MVLTLGKDFTHVSALHGIVAILVHEIVGFVHVLFVVGD